MQTKFYHITLIFIFSQTVVGNPISPCPDQAEITIRLSNGSSYTYREDQPHLPWGWSNVDEICQNGVWINFGDFNYTGYTEIYPSSSCGCHQPTFSWMESVRFAGIRNNVDTTSGTLFSDSYLSGNSLAFEHELPEIQFKVLSIVTVNSSTIEFFQEPNFSGKSVCIDMQPACIDAACWLWDWSYIDDLPWDVSAAKSAKTDCRLKTTNVYQQSVRANSPPSTVMYKV